MDWEDVVWIYAAGRAVSYWIIFAVCWIYCIATYGFLFGVGLGWLPSIIVGYLGALIWPLWAIGLLWLWKMFTAH